MAMVFLMNPVASATLFSMTALLASTTSSHVWAAPTGAASSGLYHLVFTATPFVASTISGPDILAIPVATISLSGERMMISSPSLMSGEASVTPGAMRFLLSWTNLIAPGSQTTHPLDATLGSLSAPCILRMAFHPMPMS